MSKASLKHMNENHDKWVNAGNKKKDKKSNNENSDKKQRTFWLTDTAMKKLRFAYAETGNNMSDILEKLIIEKLKV